MTLKLDKVYDPQKNEEEIQKLWEESGFFNPDKLPCAPDAPTYTIILPPPNITDKLHMGHAAMVAIEDLLIRYRRLLGDRALWLPGTDHAAIATQNVVEKKLLREKKQSRHDLGREKFLTEVKSFVQTTQGEILNQMKKLGASLDWSRLAFTLDEDRQRAVQRMFIDMYAAGAIYRGERIVNWCPRCHSTLADDELEYKEEAAKLYWIKYGPFVLATTRPETKLGDTGVAVHPDDERYKHWVGQELEISGVLGKFTVRVVADQAVDREFGSGVVKVTPAHDFTDNEIAARHNLSIKKVIDENGRMTSDCGKYAGLSSLEARQAIVEDMESMGLIDHIDDNYKHNSARCYRCGTVIEPLVSRQWFVAVSKKLESLGGLSLKEKALLVVNQGEITFIPSRFKKRYVDWMENLHDWCISRQIWFGHRIPVWYRGEEVYVGEEAPAGDDWRQDEDTLDTWFSSSLWTFSTLGWPDNFKDGKKFGDLAKFHPTQVLETGYEIITLWVSRMIMMSLFAIGEVPFKNVYLHGMVLDKEGKKMSKSKGNGVDPLVMASKFGADATRLSIIMGATPGNDVRFSEEKVEAKRNLVNKLWNISRFILNLIQESDRATDLLSQDSQPKPNTLADRWILSELGSLIDSSAKRLDAMEFSLAAEELQEFTWSKFADWYLEVVKIEKNKEEILLYILRRLLILWHPLLPHITETLWQSFNQGLLMVQSWPDKINIEDVQAKIDFIFIQNVVIAIRNARSIHKIDPGRKLKAVIYDNSQAALLKENQDLLQNLKTGLENINIQSEGEKINDAVTIALAATEIYLLGAFDSNKERERLTREITKIEKLIKLQGEKLANQEFVARAPQVLVASEQDKLATYQKELAALNESVKALD